MTSTVANAEVQKGAYLGIGAGTVHSNIAGRADRIINYTTLDEREKADVAAKFYGGYSWGMFGVEGGYYKLGNYKLSGTLGTTPAADEFSAKALGVAAVLTLPAGTDFSFFGKLGLASVTTDYSCVTLCAGVENTSTKSIVPMVGIGASWSFAKHFALRGDIETFRGAKFKYLDATEKASYDMYSISAEFHF